MTDTHYIYGLIDDNASEARRLYVKRFPERIVPDRKFFKSFLRRLHETGTLMRSGGTARTVELKEDVLNMIQEEPVTSTRRTAEILNVSNGTVWHILKVSLLYPYNIQRVQAFLLIDFPPPNAFCQWLLQKMIQIPQLLTLILFTDDANLSRNAIKNFHKNHFWCDENPHAILEHRFQHQFSLNVWFGIVDDCLIGPVFQQGRLTGEVYRNFLEYTLPEFLEDVPLTIAMWFMHGGAPPHFSQVACDFLTQTYGNRWISRGGPHLWPARSPD